MKEQEQYQFDETMIVTIPHSHEQRLNVYRLLAKEFLWKLSKEIAWFSISRLDVLNHFSLSLFTYLTRLLNKDKTLYLN
jgi:hypothetical protein